jgi:hypothetical protein
MCTIGACIMRVKRKELHASEQDKMNYEEIFHQRGHLYDRAMQSWPDARRNEFLELFKATPLKKNETILDIPSGGGYLKNYLSDDVVVDFWEISDGFLRPGVNATNIENIAENIKIKYDRAVCLAAMHHIENKFMMLQGISETIVSGGMLHVADVAEENNIKNFLDEFVDKNNPMGHKGMYISMNERLELPENLAIKRRELVNVPWIFSDKCNCVDFIRLLFGLNEDTKAEIIIEALQDYVGLDKLGDSLVLKWQLQYIDLIKQ